MTNPPAPTDISSELHASAARLRAESEHLDAMLQALVGRLSSIPGLRMTVSYRHGRIRRLIGDLPYVNDLHPRTGPIHKIAVSVAARSYWLLTESTSIRCGREDLPCVDPVSGGEELSFSSWASALFQDITEQNLINHESTVALRDLIERDTLELKEESNAAL
jgi:hypothetical protein